MFSVSTVICLPQISVRVVCRFSTIYALSSGRLPSAIAVIRISGPESKQCLQSLTRKKYFEPRKMFYTKLLTKNNKLIDRSMSVFLPGPGTYTGEDSAELFVHGSRAVVQCLFKTLNQFNNVRPAKAGEFTKRAFMNSKMTFQEVACLPHLISAQTERQHSLAISGTEISSSIASVRRKLVELAAMIEARIDFAEDVQFVLSEFIAKVTDVLEELERIQQRVHKGKLINSGINAVIIGRTNAGKSSLFNQIAAREIAIVSPEAGTTRDALETVVDVAECPVVFTDTAGIRETSDSVERQGVLRTKNKVSEADLIVVVLDASVVVDPETYVRQLLTESGIKRNVPVVVVFNKIDLLKTQPFHKLPWEYVFVSCKNNSGIDALIELIGNVVDSLCGDADTDAILSQERQRILLETAIYNLKLVSKADHASDLAILSQTLYNAVEAVGEISGAIVNEEILDNIFANFCIGK